MSIIGSNILAGASGQGGGYTIENSLRFRSSASAYLSRTPASAGNRKTWTWSGWVKRGSVTTRTALFGFGSQGTVYINSTPADIEIVAGGGTSIYLVTRALYRDPSAWYHIVIAFDTTQATAANRVKLYVNGVQVTSFSSSTYPSQNFNTDWNNTVAQYIGARGDDGLSAYWDGYMTEVHNIDGQALDASAFGEYNEDTGVWQPAAYEGTYGTNGFYLPFSDATTTTTLAADSSGNGNDWTPNGISLTAGVTYDSMTDTPTIYADGGNYAVLNPLSLGSTVTLSNANLTMTEVGAFVTTVSSIGVTSGKWYAEMTVGSNTYAGTCGIAKLGYSPTSRLGFQANTWAYNSDGGLYYNSTQLTPTQAGFTTGDVIGIELDVDNLTIKFYKNNTLQTQFYTAANSGLTAGEFYFATGHINSTSNWNFGQRPFAYTPPTGFLPLHTGNLPDSAIVDGSEYFDVLTYTGNGTGQSITGLEFQPDFVWGKSRTNVRNHNLYDSVRGAGNMLLTNGTTQELTGGELTGFNTDGFTLGSNVYQLNASGDSMVAWNWKAGTAFSNDAGTNGATIASTGSVNQDAGFSIVTYTGNSTSGATVAHSLGAEPKMVIVKARGTPNGIARSWFVYHGELGGTKFIYLDQALRDQTGSTVWNNTNPSSTVFTLGNENSVNQSTYDYVAYCFAEVEGYSKFGSYTGNGSSDGTFVYLGFRPAYLLTKRSDSAGGWHLFDSTRGAYNPDDPYLYPHLANKEYGGVDTYDLLSNGFKNTRAGVDQNASGGTYIYMAFAENPFKNSLAR